MKYSDYYDLCFNFRIVGEQGVGKSSLLTRFTEGVYNSSIKYSIGMDYRTKIVQVKDKNIKLQIWDLITTRNVRHSNQSFFRGQHGIFLIFDKTRRETFDSLQRWVYQVCQHKDMVKILVGNKCELTSEVSQDEISAFARLHKMNYVETSAKTGYNVETMFLSATEEALGYMDRGLYSDPCLGFYLESNHLLSNRYNICC